MDKLIISGVIHNTSDMLVNISNQVAAAKAKVRVNFNSIQNMELYITIIPENISELLKIYSSLSYSEFKNKNIFRVKTKDGYIRLSQFVRKYIYVHNVHTLAIEAKYVLNKYGFESIDFKDLRFKLNNIKSILCPYHRDSTLIWTKEYDTFDGTFVGPCSEEEYGAQQSETVFTYSVTNNDVALELVSRPKDTKFLVKYVGQKKLKFDSYVNGVLIQKTDRTTIYADDVDIASSYVFGNGYDKECIKYLVKEVLLDKAYMDLDKQVYDEYTFETNMLVLINYVCEGDIDKEMMYQNLLDEIITDMWVVGYFREPDEVLYDEE